MNREKLKQLTIKEWKEDNEETDRFIKEGNSSLEGSIFDYRYLKVDNFFPNKFGKDIRCVLTFKGSIKEFILLITPSVSYWEEVR